MAYTNPTDLRDFKLIQRYVLSLESLYGMISTFACDVVFKAT